jgi:hypothetical protein
VKLKALANSVLFKFMDEFSESSNTFTTYTTWGLSIAGDHQQATKGCRWGMVIATGPLCTEEVKNSKYVLILPLKWTNGLCFSHNNVDNWIWKTDEDNIVGTAHEL